MNVKIITSCILLLTNFWNLPVVISQDIHYSQYIMTPLLINPALTGAQHDMRVVLNYKNQWQHVAKSYTTYNFSYDMRLNKKHDNKGASAIGVNVFNDKAGDASMGTFQASLTYAYQLNISAKSTLGTGLYGGFVQRSISNSNFRWGDQYDGLSYNANLPSDELIMTPSKSFFDIGAGVHWEYGKEEKYITGNDQRSYNAGIALFHLSQPRYSFCNSTERLNMKWVGYGNAIFGISNTHYSIIPGVLYFQQGKAKELLLGALFRYQFRDESKYTGFIKGSSIACGGYYRINDALIAHLLYEFSQYAIGLSYDFNISGLRRASNGLGGIELTLRFVNPNPFLYSKSAHSNTKFL